MTADQVAARLEVRLTGRRSGDFLGMLFSLLVSVLLTGALGYAIAWAMHLTGPKAMGVIGATYALGLLMGAALDNKVGVADGIFSAAQDAKDRSFILSRSNDSGELLYGMGCLLILAQFVFGGLYSSLAWFFRRGPLSERQMALATALLTASSLAPVDTEAVLEQAVRARSDFSDREGRRVLAFLLKNGILERSGSIVRPSDSFQN